MSYTAIYKCALCGHTICRERYETLTTSEMAQFMEDHVIKNQDLPLLIPHDCNEWDIGLAVLSGFSFSGRVVGGD